MLLASAIVGDFHQNDFHSSKSPGDKIRSGANHIKSPNPYFTTVATDFSSSGPTFSLKPGIAEGSVFSKPAVAMYSGILYCDRHV